MPNPNHAPIQMQPQAKMMTIPGIHASHRGEVMSMGYVAPTPPPMVPAEGKSSIQSVYRLWKSPGSSQDQHQNHTESQGQSHSDSSSERDREGVAPNPAAPAPGPVLSSSPQPPRPIPPPLPPRSTPIAVTRPPLESLPSTSSSPPSASAALKSIADKDELTRATLEGSGNVTPSGESAHSRTASVEEPNSQTGSNGGVGGGTPPAATPGPPPLPPRRVVPA